MNKKLLFITLILSSSLNLQAKTNIVYMGGGGEGNKENTIFDLNITDMKTVLEKKNWDYSLSFNGGHKQTEAALKTSFPKVANRPFTEENYYKMLAEIKHKLNSNQIKSGEQLLLFIDTHGASKNDEKTHSISITDNKAVQNYDTLKGNGLVSLDKIQEIINLSEAKGVKLGIIDLSCHSGNTLNLTRNSTKTCIVTSTGPNHYGFAGKNSFANVFINQLAESPHTLETAFLEARRESNDNSYPMISTSQAELARRSLYDLISPYLQYQTSRSGKLSADIIDMAATCYDCNNASLNELIKKLENFRSVGAISSEKTNQLITKLKEYEALRKYLISQYQKLENEGSKNKEVFKSKEINPQTKKPYYTFTFTWKELAKTNEAKLNKMISGLLSKANRSNLKDYDNYKKATLALKADILKRREMVLKNNPDLIKVEKNFEDILNKSKNTFKLANDVAKLERSIYNDLYFNSKFDKSNACGTITI